MSPRATHAARCLKKGDITRRHNRVRDLLKEFGSMACMLPVLEKANLIGEAPGQRPGNVFFPNMHNGEGWRDVYAGLADGMSPADHYAGAEKHSKYDEGFVGLGSPCAQLSLRYLVVCQQRAWHSSRLSLGVLPVVWRHTVQDRSTPCAGNVSAAACSAPCRNRSWRGYRSVMKI